MEDKIILIVGGTGDIGQACARHLGEQEATVIIAGRNREKVDSLVEELKTDEIDAYGVEVEVTELPSVSKMARDIIEEHGRIDVLINAFGQAVMKPMLDTRPQTAKEIIDVNVYGTFLVTQTILRYMETERQGRVIMLPGILGKHSMKNASVYTATKHAITGFTKSLIQEQKRGFVKFTLLYLGGVATQMWDDERVTMKVRKDKMLTPEDAARAVEFAISQPQKSALNELTLQPESHQEV